MLNSVGIFLLQLKAVFPRGTVHHPVLVIDLIDAQQDALLVLPHVGKALQINGHGHLEIKLLQLRDRVRDQIVMIERRERQLNPCHAPHLLGPKACGIDHMFGVDRAIVRDNLPARGGLVQLHHVGVFVYCHTVFLGRPGIGVHGACGVNIALPVRPHATKDAIGDMIGHNSPASSGVIRRQSSMPMD